MKHESFNIYNNFRFGIHSSFLESDLWLDKEREAQARYNHSPSDWVFLGSLTALLNFDGLSVKAELSGFHLMIGLILLALIWCIFMAGRTNDSERRDVYIGTSIFGGMAFMLILAVGGMVVSETKSQDLEMVASELVLIAEHHIEKDNTERAIAFYSKAAFQFSLNDPRRKKLEDKIEELKSNQF